MGSAFGQVVVDRNRKQLVVLLCMSFVLNECQLQKPEDDDPDHMCGQCFAGFLGIASANDCFVAYLGNHSSTVNLK